jgi:nitrate reductase gamma subunit
MTDLAHFAEHTLQEVALLFMATVYTIRVIWFLRFKAGKERQAPTGPADTTPRRGIIYSWANVAMPWAMESSRTKAFFYAQFVVFHLGVTAAILMSFLIPYAAGFMSLTGVATVTAVICGLATLVGVMRIYRRFTNRHVRAISSPDDFFSPILLTVWLGFAAATAWMWPAEGWIRTTYFVTTAFFLVYVPFSKISHYLYYPFTRYYLGKTLGRRGVYPVRTKGYEATL